MISSMRGDTTIAVIAPACAATRVCKALLLLSLGALVFAACGSGAETETSSSVAASAAAPGWDQAQAKEKISAGEIEVRDLPPEARALLQLIKRGGPFAYAQDGTVFSNREGLLPARQRGFYHEYTVKTPGARDRGARRIIAGQNGEYYYTEDHYRSFKRIREHSQ
jgi:ribonuclease T1